MQDRPPIIRRSSLRRPTRSQLARRRAGVVVVVVLIVVGIWQFWPAGGTGATVAGPGVSSGPTGSTGPTPSTIVPGDNPIKHVIFLIKENHTFDNYFGKYPGADGATEGPTLKCDQGFAPDRRCR